jgi:hypothetical protein
MLRRFLRDYERYIFVFLVMTMFLITLWLFYHFPLVFILISTYIIAYAKFSE